VRPGGPLAGEVKNWREFLRTEADDAALESLRRHGRTGRPLGSLEFLLELESRLARCLRRQKPGPRPRKARGGIK